MSLPKASINDNNNKLKSLSTLRSSSFGAVNMIHSNALHHNTNKKQIPRGSRDMRKQKVQKVQKITENLLCIMVDPKSDSNKKGSRINTIFSSHNWGS
ncbi:CLUMA_CG013366, isoform A [Clunio marinus]|uniref:CLUMA_CG013366, isoform A n=1 Tax=Clunio marinus TaxID=568069 RepID=A0A1J1IKL8_9DIPT|nr:CLUMA_CG013366, isoform A [Clunio marinus]